MATQQPAERFFASDNASPVHPRILHAMAEANDGHAVAYGEDHWTQAAQRAFRELFDEDVETFFVYNGTGANVLAVAGIVPSFGAVVCTEMAHLNEDEAGAPEKFAGCKLLAADREDGKLGPEDVERLGAPGRVPHQSVPYLVSITQSTEVGTVYTPQEVRALCSTAHDLGLLVHVDGARIANAAVAVAERRAGTSKNVSHAEVEAALREMTVEAGVDAISFGGTKNGLMFGEALVFLSAESRKRSAVMPSLQKQGMQLASKMRYIAAQFLPYIQEGLWITNAVSANQMAKRLSSGLQAGGIHLAYPPEANGVFPRIPRDRVSELQARWPFYIWDESHEVCRLMCSFDTAEEEVDAFIQALVDGDS
ncbi:MAG: threonine aldolase [Spirochaetes bacterium]|jgi:threonine aldolase|nr:threonine aldolase [Spirochaetota bacterium]